MANEEQKGCYNCKNQPSPLTTCELAKHHTVFYPKCPYWEKKRKSKNYGELYCGHNCRECEWYGICPHSYAQYDKEAKE